MKIHYGLEKETGAERSVVTTGTFDGMHIGHQAIIRRINELADELGGESVLITFHPHPRKILYPDNIGKDIRMITTQREKTAMLEKTGIDHLVIIPFTKEFVPTPSEVFIRDLLAGKLKVIRTVVGFNHFFGFNKEGNYRQLENLDKELGFTVDEIPEQYIQNETVSSTLIRQAIEEGNIQIANSYPNNILMMMGVPEHIDIDLAGGFYYDTLMICAEEAEKLLPPEGFYAVRINQASVDIKALAVNNPALSQPGSLILLPLEDVAVSPDTKVLFHRQLLAGNTYDRSGSAINIERAVTEAKELIY